MTIWCASATTTSRTTLHQAVQVLLFAHRDAVLGHITILPHPRELAHDPELQPVEEHKERTVYQVTVTDENGDFVEPHETYIVEKEDEIFKTKQELKNKVLEKLGL